MQRATGGVSWWSPKLNKLARRRISVIDYTLRAHYMTMRRSRRNQRAITRGWLSLPSGLFGPFQCCLLRDGCMTELFRPFRAGALLRWTNALRHRTGLDLGRKSVEAVSRRPAVIADASGAAVQGLRGLT